MGRAFQKAAQGATRRHTADYRQGCASRIWNEWCKDWVRANLTKGQRGKRRSQQTIIFAAYFKQIYGHKYVVFGILQTGITSASRGSVKDVAESFVAWVRTLVSAIAHANDQPEYREAQQRSGTARGQHGLTANQLEARDVRNAIQGDLNWALHLKRNSATARARARKNANAMTEL